MQNMKRLNYSAMNMHSHVEDRYRDEVQLMENIKRLNYYTMNAQPCN